MTSPTEQCLIEELVFPPDRKDLIERYIDEEETRQTYGLEMIASENYTSVAVRRAMGSCLTNKYSEGTVGRRYYGGTGIIDKIEVETQTRALIAFNLDAAEWAVNVQPLSGSPANFQVYSALLEPGERLMGLDLPSGGHLTHGYFINDRVTGAKKPISFVSKFFDTRPYYVNPETGFVDYVALATSAAEFQPKIIVCGGSAYSRDWDYPRLRDIADSVGAILMCDMAHTAGLIASQLLASPFEWCDIVTTTTHKTLRGPRGGMIFSRRRYQPLIDAAVFPGLQGGPHNHQIAAIGIQMAEVMTPEFRRYSAQTISNTQALVHYLLQAGRGQIVTGGTDNHLFLWDLRSEGITGSKMEKVCEAVEISINKNTVPGDKSALSPGGVRIGMAALTTRGVTERHISQIANFLIECLDIALAIQIQRGKKLTDFLQDLDIIPQVVDLRSRVKAFAGGLARV